MRFSSLVLSRTMQVIVVFIIAALAVTPRSGATVNAPNGSRSRPLTSATYCPSSVYCYEFVNYNSSDNNYITGINNFQVIDGAYGSNGGPYGSFAAKNSDFPNTLSPYTNFTPESDGTLSTYLSGLDDGTGGISSLYQVGDVVQPLLSETEGAILHSGTWALFRNPNEGGGTCAVTQVLAIDDSRIGVGFYETSGNGGICIKHAFEFYSNSTLSSPYTFVDLTPTDPSGSIADVTSSVATGINTLGDVVGTITWTQNGTPHTGGWIYRDLKYTTFCHAAAQSTSCSGSPAPTYANGINFSDVVVGDYTDQSGQHGFAITNPWKAGTFTTIDTSYPNTVLWSINEGTGTKSEFFAGWTTPAGSNPKALGIVGICKASHCSKSASTLRRSPDRLNVGHFKKARP
jgi:hypothetical protein